MNKIKVGILGATGVVGQRFAQMLADHPYFDLTVLAASDRSAGKTYREAANWILPQPMSASLADMGMLIILMEQVTLRFLITIASTSLRRVILHFRLGLKAHQPPPAPSSCRIIQPV